MHLCLPYAAEDLSTAGCRLLAPSIEIQVLRAEPSMRAPCAARNKTQNQTPRPRAPPLRRRFWLAYQGHEWFRLLLVGEVFTRQLCMELPAARGDCAAQRTQALCRPLSGV